LVSLNLGPIIPPTEDLDGLEGEPLVDAIVDWFRKNYEDPAENTPYESAEGGYQYIWGGPYDAREEIETYLGEFPDTILRPALARLERTAVEWAPNDGRIFDEDPPENPYADVQSALDGLEAAFAQVHPIPSGIGGNNPPEEIGVPPYTDEDHRDVLQAIHVLRAPESILAKEPENAERAAEKLKAVGEKVCLFLKDQGKLFADAFSTEAGKRTAQVLTAYTTWQLFGAQLMSVYEAVKAWLPTLSNFPHPPF
jgi:hypothetical protein